jgi:hypothetical protein
MAALALAYMSAVPASYTSPRASSNATHEPPYHVVKFGYAGATPCAHTLSGCTGSFFAVPCEIHLAAMHPSPPHRRSTLLPWPRLAMVSPASLAVAVASSCERAGQEEEEHASSLLFAFFHYYALPNRAITRGSMVQGLQLAKGSKHVRLKFG